MVAIAALNHYIEVVLVGWHVYWFLGLLNVGESKLCNVCGEETKMFGKGSRKWNEDALSLNLARKRICPLGMCMGSWCELREGSQEASQG